MYRLTGLWIAPPGPSGWNPDQDGSGVGALPVRVANVTPSSVPSAVSTPHEVMRRSASKTREMNVPDGIGARLMSSTVSGMPLRVKSLASTRRFAGRVAVCDETRASST